MNSQALFLLPSNMAGPDPFRAPSVGARTDAGGLGWLRNPQGIVGGAKELACTNWKNDTLGFTWGILTPALKEF